MMSAESEEFAAGGCRPHFGGVVVTGGGQLAAIGGPGDAPDRTLMIAEGEQLAAGRFLPHFGGVVVTRGCPLSARPPHTATTWGTCDRPQANTRPQSIY